MVIRQGDVFWVELGDPSGSAPAYRRPYVVVQNDALNSSRLRTTIVCAVTSNLERAKAAGNVRLAEGEADLPKPCVVNVSQVITLDKADLREKIGRLSPRRLGEVLEGLFLVLEPVELEGS